MADAVVGFWVGDVGVDDFEGLADDLADGVVDELSHLLDGERVGRAVVAFGVDHAGVVISGSPVLGRVVDGGSTERFETSKSGLLFGGEQALVEIGIARGGIADRTLGAADDTRGHFQRAADGKDFANGGLAGGVELRGFAVC